jgi:hypothetical protein
MLRLLGWINLTFAIVIAAVILIPSLHGGQLPTVSTAALIAASIALPVGYLVVGSGLKRGAPWARAAGIVVALLSLLDLPIGTVIGLIALIYLVRSLNEPATAPTADTKSALPASAKSSRWRLRAAPALIAGIAASGIVVMALLFVASHFEKELIDLLVFAAYLPILSIPVALLALGLLVAVLGGVGWVVARQFWPNR